VLLGNEIIEEYKIPFQGIIVESEEKPNGSQINQHLKEQYFPEKEDVFYDLITDISEIKIERLENNE
jgi:hypothetical protein